MKCLLETNMGVFLITAPTRPHTHTHTHAHTHTHTHTHTHVLLYFCILRHFFLGGGGGRGIYYITQVGGAQTEVTYDHATSLVVNLRAEGYGHSLFNTISSKQRGGGIMGKNWKSCWNGLLCVYQSNWFSWAIRLGGTGLKW